MRWRGAQSADSISLDTFGASGVEAVVALFATWGLAQLVFSVLVQFRKHGPFDTAARRWYALAVKGCSSAISIIRVAVSALLVIGGALGQAPGPSTSPDTALHKAAREGDVAKLRSLLDVGADPNQRDGNGNRPLIEAVAAGQRDAVRVLIAAGADPNLTSSGGRTPLIEGAIRGRMEIAELLISAGADLNISDRGAGTALEAAEREGHTELAALLRRSGARSSGRSVGDKVCVRPWKGDGYCGIVEAIDRNEYRLRVSQIVGCANGCSAMAACSAGKPVGGSSGLKAGDTITAASSCLTHTGVPK
jgi:hypothetical protein